MVADEKLELFLYDSKRCVVFIWSFALYLLSPQDFRSVAIIFVVLCHVCGISNLESRIPRNGVKSADRGVKVRFPRRCQISLSTASAPVPAG